MAPVFDPALPVLPFELQAGGAVLRCDTMLRHLPRRRLVCGGSWRGRDVVAKLYIDARRARAHARREERGVRAMLERGIVTPALLYAGQSAYGHVLIFERIRNARSVRELWHGSGVGERKQLLDLLVRAVAALHKAGLLQEDLHTGNFLHADGHVYAVDGDGIRIVGTLSRERALGNLELLLAQLQPEDDALFIDAYACYARARGWSDAGAETFVEHVKARRTACIDTHLAQKVFRECTAFSACSTWRRFTVIDRRYDSAALRTTLSDLDRLMAEGRPLKLGRSSTVSVIEVDGLALVVKRYNLKSVWHALLRALQPTRAAISWRNAQRLTLYGIPTPFPIALVENRFGPLRRVSYVITKFRGGENAAAYFARVTPDQARPVAERIVRLLQQLGKLKLSHGDLKATNLLICDEDVFLTDLDALKQHRRTETAARAHAEDLRRFTRNWKGLPEAERLFQALLQVQS